MLKQLLIKPFAAAGILCACFFFMCTSLCKAQPPVFRMQSYVDAYSEEAIYQMLEYRIPASVILAQAIFESQSGNSELAQKSNNHFGIKCHVEWGGDTVVKHDDTLNECFRKYGSIRDSYTDHSLFLVSRARYAPLFELPSGDYKSWCYGLKAAGYATYPNYAEDLILIIEQLRLNEIDGYQAIEPINALDLIRHDLRPRSLSFPPPSLKDLCRYGLLWTDERDILIQSLDLLLEQNDEADSDVADR